MKLMSHSGLRNRMTLRTLAVLLCLGLLGALQPLGSWAVGCPTVSETGVVTPFPGPDANLSGCDLTDANLTNANLTRANLTGATLTGADFTGAGCVPVTAKRSLTVVGTR